MALGAELAAVAVELIPGIAGADNVTIGTSTITGGTNGRVLYDNSGLIGEKAVTGSGSVVLQTSPAITSPALTTPDIGVAVGTSASVTGVLAAWNATALPAGGTAGKGVLVSSTANFGLFFGSGAPTLSAAKGSIYMRSDGSGVNDRAYVNTDGGTTWTALVTVA